MHVGYARQRQTNPLQFLQFAHRYMSINALSFTQHNLRKL
jgi:hypothetical protein